MSAEPSGGVNSGKVVLDTNIWISAALSRDGAPARVVRRVLADGLPVFSSATFAELETRLWRPKFDRYLSMESRRKILSDLRSAAHWVDVPPKVTEIGYCRDADDDKFIHAALAADALWLVTGDADLLAVPAMNSLRIVTAGDALNAEDFCQPK
ncbi:MAG: putative toxin-antitoxin system toxin component, PIN family [Casimicrobium sp.]